MWTYESLSSYHLVRGLGFCLWARRADTPMDAIIQEVDKALRARLYYLAVMMALALPDICAALESPSGETSGHNAQAYKDWFDANLSSRFKNFTAADCYSMRCGVVHQGRFGHRNMQYSRVIFMLPDGRGTTFHDCVLNDAYFYTVEEFCREIINGVREWFALHQTDPNVIANLPRLVQVHPTGLSPYVLGQPVIA